MKKLDFGGIKENFEKGIGGVGSRISNFGENTGNLGNDDEDNDDEDEDYDDEDYDDEDYDDEDEEGLSLKELELLSIDYAEPVSDDPIEELAFLLDHYFQIHKVSPEFDEEEELKLYAQEVIRAIVLEYEIPADNLAYLFKFVLTVESFYEKNPNDIIFKEIDTEEDIKTLKLRLDEFLAEYPDLFNDFEVYETLFDIEKPLTETKLYEKTLDNFYTTLINDASFDSFEVMVDLYTEKREKADKYFAKMPIPSENAGVLASAFFVMIESSHTGSTMTKKINEAKAIIAAKYPDDEYLKSLLARLDIKKTAKLYKRVKFGSLGVAGVLLLIHWIAGLVAGVAWAAIFFSPLHDKIPFLAKGKECLNKK